MIKIKDYIFNEDGIVHIKENENKLLIIFRDLCSHDITLDATFYDIEWNYGEKENTDLITLKDYVRDNWGEEFNKNTTLKEMIERIILRYNCVEEDLQNEVNNYKEMSAMFDYYKLKIDKAMEYCGNTTRLNAGKVIKILKGEK